jgi:uncharacterized membrane protein
MKRYGGMLVVWMGLAAVGFLDAAYLAIEHYRGVVPPCSLVEGCEVVTTSAYATLFGMPVALLGALYYLALLMLAVRSLETRDDRYLRLGFRLTAIGAAMSVWFVYVQVGILRAICIYCIVSAAASFSLFLVSHTGSRRPGQHGKIDP